MGGWRAEGSEKPGGFSSSLGCGWASRGGCVSSVAPASQAGRLLWGDPRPEPEKHHPLSLPPTPHTGVGGSGILILSVCELLSVLRKGGPAGIPLFKIPTLVSTFPLKDK